MKNKYSYWVSFMLVLASLLAACGGAATTEAPPPTEAEATPVAPPPTEVEATPVARYHEAPMLADLVADGQLPPVEERMPDDPVVVEPIENIGTYGGTLRMMHFWAGAENIKMVVNDPPITFDPYLTAIQPNLFENTGDYSADGLTLTWKLREGLRWSDGEPFTTEDLMFWWDNMVNDERCATPANPWLWGGGDPATGTPPQLSTLEAPDEYTLTIRLPAPNFAANTVWAVGFWEFQETNMVPAHYLKQFHPAFNSDYADCQTLIEVKNNWFFDPDYPVLGPWRTVEVVPGERLVLERNPYYWKVDTEGNQLPYIDRVESRFIPDQQARNLAVLNGEIDIAIRELDRRDRTLFIDNEERCDCRVVPGWVTGGMDPLININHTYVGEVPGMAELLRNPDFKRGLSVAIDRQRILDTVWSGLGYVSNSDCVLASFIYDIPDRELAEKVWREWNDSYAQYDPDLANQYLDAAGLTNRDSEGFRTQPDGSRLEVVLLVTDFAIEEVNASTAALTRENWEAVGVRSVISSATGDAYYSFSEDSTWQIFVASSGTFGEWLYPTHIFEPLSPAEGVYPLGGQWYTSGGERGIPPDPGSPAARFIELYEAGLREPDPAKRVDLLIEGVQIHIDQPFDLGTVANVPELVVARHDLRNIVEFGITGPWTANAPGVAIPAQWYYAQP